MDQVLANSELCSLIAALPDVDTSDLHGLELKQLTAIFEETLNKFRDLSHTYRSEADKCSNLIDKIKELNLELDQREERLQERQQKLSDGRFLAEYREEQHSTVQEVYHIESAPAEPEIDYVPVVRLQSKPTPNRDVTVDDGLVSKRLMTREEAVKSLIKHIEMLRKLILNYEEKVKNVRDKLRMVEEELGRIREAEQALLEREELVTSRERQVIAESVSNSFVGA
ncbi:unnamed protein product [Bursaphelenchus okinawaensis]|uniref:Uncharacterized protein n=1 Tax=Bursaphelenchus okinawaensis TaxID=465554 RepID=A0A811JQ38_9BILA|nr:unnamed protein product [Bursaphelenchus okinawaensis]CAG9077087.1 unnamed protein product [Bursaphelenchus okinawaensis]